MDQPKVDNLLHISWGDSHSVPMLNASNILDYFTERSNPFYSRECTNEYLKMQQNTRLEQLQQMTGTEYILLHTQEPILYIIRKQQRYSPTHVTALSCYHIIGGQVFQTPDLGSVINSRLVSVVNHLNGAFNEMKDLSQYHPSKGYWWQTQKQAAELADTQKKKDDKKANKKEEVSSIFQRRRVDSLLGDLAVRFPYKGPPATTTSTTAPTTAPSVSSTQAGNHATDTKTEPKSEVKQEPKTEIKMEIKQEPKTEPSPQTVPQRSASKPPPEKRQKTGP